MTAPRRWKDTHDAPVGVRELLSAGRAGPPPRALDGATFERGASRVAKLGAAPAAAAAGVAVGVWTKVAAAAVIGLASVGAVVAVSHVVPADSERGVVERGPSNANADADAKPDEDGARAAAALTAASGGNLDVGIVAPTSKVAAPVRAAVLTHSVGQRPAAASPAAANAVGEPAPASTATASPGTLGAEISLLEDARAALARDPATALVRVAQHRARFPSGVLGAERDLIELDALRRAGRTTEARVQARAWLEREPSGLHATRVRAILASLERTPD